MPFAVVTRSGTTSSCSEANIAPVRAKPVWISSATSSAPFARHHSCRAGRNPGAGTTNPPSPCTGSITTAATWSAPTCFSTRSSARRAACSPVIPRGSRKGYDIGARCTSPANGPKPFLYGITLAVMAIVRFVRPWYPWSKTTTASRPVAWRAILTAFSTASAPELSSTLRLSWSPGVSRASASQTSR